MVVCDECGLTGNGHRQTCHYPYTKQIESLKLQLSALASEAKNAVSWLHGCAPHASDPGHVRKLADRLWALADKAEGKGSVA